MVQNPGDFEGAGEGRRQQAGLLAHPLGAAVCEEGVAPVARAQVRPDDGRIDRPAGFAVPEQRRFTLVGDADSRDVVRFKPGRGDGFGGDAGLRRPQLHRVLLDPARTRRGVRDRLFGDGDQPARVVEHQGARAREALIQREHHLLAEGARTRAHGRALREKEAPGLLTGVRTQLAVGMLHMHADRAQADAEFGGDLLPALPGADMVQNRLLALGQRCGFFLRGHRLPPPVHGELGIKYPFFI